MKPRSELFSAIRTILLTAALVAAAGCAEWINTAGETVGRFHLTKRVVSARQVANESYRLQINDEIEILLSSRPESGVRVEVQKDGSAFYPPVGILQAQGKTLQELEKEIQDRLNAEGAPESGSEQDRPIGSTEEITPQQAVGQLYRLQRGDQLEIAIWDHSDLNQKVLIREDGTFVFPLIGTVAAVDRTISEMEQEIAERLNKDYIVNPQVSARLTAAQVSILGMKGGESGNIPFDGSMDLMTALSKAGDIDVLRSSRVEIIRRLGDKRYAIKTEVDRVLRGKEPNLPILPRDTIYLQMADTGRVLIRLVDAKFTALGEIATPGVHPIEGAMDLLTAVSVAGGITKFGSNQVEIIRTVGNQRLVIRSNINRILQGREPNFSIFPRDTLYVKRRLF